MRGGEGRVKRGARKERRRDKISHEKKRTSRERSRRRGLYRKLLVEHDAA